MRALQKLKYPKNEALVKNVNSFPLDGSRHHKIERSPTKQRAEGGNTR